MMNALSVLFWPIAMFARLPLLMIGLFIVPMSLVSDGVKRTSDLWKMWIDAEDKPEWWNEDRIPKWTYAYLPLISAFAWWSYGHWYPLITIWLIFSALGALFVVYSKERWTKFWWFALRNPTRGFARMFKQPILEPRPNPDDLVYTKGHKSASRWLRHGIFSEFWYLRAVGKNKFEFRVGWKFADGTPGFGPTISLRLGD